MMNNSISEALPQEYESGLEIEKANDSALDDDGKPRRRGTMWTASAHIITTIIGSGVLSLSWVVAQLGWLGGIGCILAFAFITFYTADLLASCYRSPITGKRNYTYMEAVKNNLGEKMQKICGLMQYTILSGATIGYTITASQCMAAIQRSNCFHKKGSHNHADCSGSHNPFMLGLGVVEIFFSQIPNFHQLSMLSTVAAIMSFLYSFIGFGLGLAKVVSGTRIYLLSRCDKLFSMK
ncbi:hypothetical protein Leryth_003548 [Lithospermum erythrorhizon]|nr:hypothetical protein Leryth_003548 [Lithospermum erythrorhizon]